jgi:hypothetical protein
MLAALDMIVAGHPLAAEAILATNNRAFRQVKG